VAGGVNELEGVGRVGVALLEDLRPKIAAARKLWWQCRNNLCVPSMGLSQQG
jgi:hypothetical protein